MAIEKHARRQIREKLAIVLNGLPTTGVNVFPGRVHDLTDSEIPAIIITTAANPGERSEVSSFGPVVKLDRTVQVVVIGFDRGIDIEDRLDRIAVEVEEAIAVDQESPSSKLLEIAKDVRLVSTLISIRADDKVRAGQISLTYEMDYQTTRRAPQTPIA